MGFNGQYVVGFIGNDDYLGRTISGEYKVALEAMKVLFDENDDEATVPKHEYWVNNCAFTSDMGTYFLGGLEHYTLSTVCNC